MADQIADATRRAVTHLISTQHTDGGWGQHGGAASDVLSTAQAVPVIVAHGDPNIARRAIAYLLVQQDADGGFTSVPDQVGPQGKVVVTQRSLEIT